jgi:hypothetical protein
MDIFHHYQTTRCAKGRPFNFLCVNYKNPNHGFFNVIAPTAVIPPKNTSRMFEVSAPYNPMITPTITTTVNTVCIVLPKRRNAFRPPVR